MPIAKIGYSDGDQCNRNINSLRCHGIIAIRPPTDCYCHISPPCEFCIAPRAYCAVCDWDERNDIIINNSIINVHPNSGFHYLMEPRHLDPTKVDWHSFQHTNSTMIREGVYPVEMSRTEVEKLVIGTFGGRFETFGNGRFRYIAYTD